MKQAGEVTTLFLDVGGVLLSKGWGHESRALAAQRFGLDPAEMQQRHNLTFDTYEVGKLSLDEYLDRTVFYQPRPFTRDQFREFIFAQSQPHPEMIELVCKLKRRHALKIAVVNNEGRELNSHRIRAFKLGAFADFFISSCFVHFRKPDVRHLPPGVGHRPSAGRAGRIYRRRADVRADRTKPGDSRHPPH